MGFLTGLGRFLSGKPVFVPGESEEQIIDSVSASDTTQIAAANDLHDSSGRKIAPQINVSHVKSHVAGNTMSVTAWITNNSSYDIRIDSCNILSHHVNLYRNLSPGQGHEAMLYRGPVATNNHDYRVRFIFRISENTDEFEMNYVVRFYRNSDGTFVIDQLDRNGTIKDI
ncbi:MAG: hypothetical protein L0H36_01730 [bacterium]|nr:hypothetical protein [bacterium]MDN5835334.1 hypothetical protein [bacterium]